jgi:hypothetical protein
MNCARDLGQEARSIAYLLTHRGGLGLGPVLDEDLFGCDRVLPAKALAPVRRAMRAANEIAIARILGLDTGGTGGTGGNCDRAHYPSVCIAPYPPDLDCGEVAYQNFAVLGSDPHGFDGNDNDGVGCET